MELHDLLSVVPYRCVCGNTIALINDQDRRCLLCDREVPASEFRKGDMTIIGCPEPITERFEQPQEEFDSPSMQRLKHFRILEQLGQGGMGEVYRAVDESLERDVAIKIIRKAQLKRNNQTEARCMQRLLEEARAQARISHPNVVQVYYVDAHGETPFLAMEYVSGETLESRMSRQPLEFSEIVNIAIQTSQALQAAEQFHIVHGDIKPANLLISRNGVVKLSDFGLARPVDLINSDSTAISGTPNYLSPEACRGEGTDHRSDIYSLGIVLFEMTFSRLPYQVDGQPVMSRILAHINSSVDFPQKWPDELPGGWKTLLERMLAKEPKDRFDNYDELLEELEKLQPVVLPVAGRIVRSMAWAIDLSVMFLMIQLARTLLRGGLEFWGHTVQMTLEVPINLLAIMVAASIQGISGYSPGKKLMQIRVIDIHGLQPKRSLLFQRSMIQLLPIWGLISLRCFTAMGLDQLGLTVFLVLSAFSLIDALFAIVRPDGRSFHDLVFETNVALDLKQRKATVTKSRSLPSRHRGVYGGKSSYSCESTSPISLPLAGVTWKNSRSHRSIDRGESPTRK
ncbi:protein kinase domain-containing protein [Planctomicrobium sp. SH527]|uniref:protein kinase domain-containing protein n=1 Tax=Planctomicrobium sp. SH527 TaxID=3448123 RepID=UPI003F5BD4F0